MFWLVGLGKLDGLGLSFFISFDGRAKSRRFDHNVVTRILLSLPVGIVFLISVNIELILRNFLSNFTKLELPEDLDKQKLETQ